MITLTKKLVTVLIGLFLGEVAIMALINGFQLPAFAEAIADASVLILIALPILYLQFARPMFEQYQVIEKANRTAEILLQASAEFASSMELDQVSNTLFHQVRILVPYDFAAVYWLESPDRLSRKATWKEGRNLAVDAEQNPELTLRDFPVLLKVIEEKQSIYSSDTCLEAEWLDHLSADHLCSWLGVPLMVGGKVIGLFEIGRFEPADFTQDHIRLVESIASQASVVIQNAKQYEQVRESQAQLKTLTHKIVEIQERERRWIAVELHEHMVQTIAASLMKVRFLGDRADLTDLFRSELEDLDQKLSIIFQDLRAMAINLHPLVLETNGLRAAIRQDLAKMRDENHLQIGFEESSQLERLPKETEIVLYRTVQEVFTNVVQHAQATRVKVTLAQEGKSLILLVEDNGIGFSLKKLNQATCLGILGMRERVEMIGGTLLIESSLGKGTAIKVIVPILEKEDNSGK